MWGHPAKMFRKVATRLDRKPALLAGLAALEFSFHKICCQNTKLYDQVKCKKLQKTLAQIRAEGWWLTGSGENQIYAPKSATGEIANDVEKKKILQVW